MAFYFFVHKAYSEQACDGTYSLGSSNSFMYFFKCTNQSKLKKTYKIDQLAIISSFIPPAAVAYSWGLSGGRGWVDQTRSRNQSNEAGCQHFKYSVRVCFEGSRRSCWRSKLLNLYDAIPDSCDFVTTTTFRFKGRTGWEEGGGG